MMYNAPLFIRVIFYDYCVGQERLFIRTVSADTVLQSDVERRLYRSLVTCITQLNRICTPKKIVPLPFSAFSIVFYIASLYGGRDARHTTH